MCEGSRVSQGISKPTKIALLCLAAAVVLAAAGGPLYLRAARRQSRADREEGLRRLALESERRGVLVEPPLALLRTDLLRLAERQDLREIVAGGRPG